MTELRDQFAMAALTGLVARSLNVTPESGAQQAYSYAEAMMEARALKQEPLVEDLKLSLRALNLLEAVGVRTIAQLRKTTRKDLIKAGGSLKTIDEIFKTSWEAGP